jgi:hypothetical protein
MHKGKSTNVNHNFFFSMFALKHSINPMCSQWRTEKRRTLLTLEPGWSLAFRFFVYD